MGFQSDIKNRDSTILAFPPKDADMATCFFKTSRAKHEFVLKKIPEYRKHRLRMEADGK